MLFMRQSLPGGTKWLGGYQFSTLTSVNISATQYTDIYDFYLCVNNLSQRLNVLNEDSFISHL